MHKSFCPKQGGILESRLFSGFGKVLIFKNGNRHDMLGISYENHPRLKRILMPESWIGWPLRKDYIAPTQFL